MKVRIGVMLLCCLVWMGLAAAEDPTIVSWMTLVELDYQTGQYPDELGQLNGTTIQLPGYVVPLHTEGNEILELNLVPQFGMCIHIPPPPPNQMVYVKLKESVKFRDVFARPIWITGKFNIVSTDSKYGSTGFTIADANVRPYEVPKQ
ncbi:DUF3299 domain-containing protein [Candidatus Entotheonella palauensis]|uniref:DUF3299 domain-containing protein n=1 Tax=Candidatus Entotheonella palauensis TaxID=93172 RepID=UPI000B7FFB1B|nr:DUF3299 domain-containing protein [Candidatus Entotheonella palauensis]